MENIARYILSVTAAALLLGILQTIAGKKGTQAVLLQLIGGLFLTFTVISPIVNIEADEILDLPWAFTLQGSTIAEQGQSYSRNQLRRIIKDRTEAYILDKALTLQAQLQVEVMLSQDEVPVPTSVRLQGSVSPYARNVLQQWLQDDMAIPKEHQIWIG